MEQSGTLTHFFWEGKMYKYFERQFNSVYLNSLDIH